MLDSRKKRKSVVNLFIPTDELPFPDNLLDHFDQLDLLGLYSGDRFGRWIDVETEQPYWTDYQGAGPAVTKR